MTCLYSVILKCNVGVNHPQPNWQPNWHKACNESLFGEVGQDGLFHDLIVTCNDGADVPQPNRY